MSKLPYKIDKDLKKFQVQNETLVRDVKSNPADRIELEIGDVKQPDFKPQAKIKRWDNEVNFSLRRKKEPTVAGSTVNTKAGRIVVSDEEEEVHIYEKPELGEDGGIEIEILLKDKPSTNRFDFSIETKGLVFYKQLKLSQSEIDAGAIRPDNVINSYAVYHKTNTGNIIGGKEYKSGKAFHIYRPHITDADGNETWGDLEINEEEKTLTVIVPKDFLNRATYPVIVDPTIGYDTAGSSGGWGYNYSASAIGMIGAVIPFIGTIDTIDSVSVHGSQRTGHAADPDYRMIVASTGDIILDYTATGSLSATDAWHTQNTVTPGSIAHGSLTDVYVALQVVDRGFSVSYDSAPGYSYCSDATTLFTATDGDSTSIDVDSATTDIRTSVYFTYTTSETGPTVTTQAASGADTQTYEIDLNGNITSVGTEDCIDRGFVWSTATFSDPGDNPPEDVFGGQVIYSDTPPFGTGAFSETMIVPVAGFTYYYRAFAHNLGGWDYGAEQTFSIPTAYPRVDTYVVATIKRDTGANLRGFIAADGNQTITARGFVYGTTSPSFTNYVAPGSTSYDTFTQETGSFSAGIFNLDIEDLEPDTLYYFRAYATNASGTEYGGEFSFRTPRAGVWTIDPTAGFLGTVSPISSGLPYFSQVFEAETDYLERIGIQLRAFAAITGTMVIHIVGDDAGDPDLTNTIWTSPTIGPELDVSAQRFFFDVQEALTAGDTYHVVADGTNLSAGSVAIGFIGDGTYYKTPSFMKYGSTGTSWSLWTNPLYIYAEFTYPRATVTTAAVDDEDVYSIDVSANLTDKGGDSIVSPDIEEYGVYYGTSTVSSIDAVSEAFTILDEESFETNFGGWVSSGTSGWLRDSGGTGSSDTGPSAAYDGTWYLYIETSSGSGTYDAGGQDYLTYDLGGPTDGAIDFAYHQYGTEQGVLNFEVFDGETWNIIWQSQNDLDAWQTVAKEETRFFGATQIRFRNEKTDTGFHGDVALDDITIYTLTHAAPQEDGITAGYDGVDTTSSDPGTGTFYATADELDPNTTYYLRPYVKTHAGYTYGGEVTTDTLTTPTVVLNTADAASFPTDTPALQFTGTDTEADDLTYEVYVIGSTSTNECDSFVGNFTYSGGNLIQGTQPALGQSFTGNGEVLSSATFALAKNVGGNPTGDIIVKVWSVTGTHGTDAEPDTLLATSDPVEASTAGIPEWSTTSDISFTFPEDQQIVLGDGTKYALTIQFAGTGSDYLIVKRRQADDANHDGNFIWTADNSLVTWNSISTWDNLFSVDTYITDFVEYGISDSDSGFANTEDGGDTDPFTSGELMEYTVQTPLDSGTYYWKARATDPSPGNDSTSEWTATRSFNVTGWLTGWTYRVPVTVQSSEVSNSVSNFPVYVDLSHLPAGFHTNVKTDGSDIRVTTSDGSTEVPREVVYYDSTADDGELHFLASALTDAADVTYYIYYGNAVASDYATDGTYGAENVWTPNFEAVWHMSEDPSGSAPQIIDSTGNGYDMSSVGSMVTGDLVDSDVGKGLDFDGSAQYLVTPSSHNTYAGTVGEKAWVSAVMSNINTSATDMLLSFSQYNGMAHIDGYWFYQSQGDNSGTAEAGMRVTTTDPHHVSFLYDQGTEYVGYLNGVEGVQKTITDTESSNDTIRIGNGHGSAATREFQGNVSEVRWGYADLGADWALTEHNNLLDTANFYTAGAEEEESVDDSTESITKSVTYTVIADDVQTKGLVYNIITTDSQTKSVAYEVVDTSAITKSLKYTVPSVDSVTKSLTYDIDISGWLTGWGYRVPITVQSSEVDENVTNFPVFVELNTLPESFHTHVKADGGDIRITTDDGETELPREVVSYQKVDVTGYGEVHFKADSLSASSNTTFYLYYGNAAASDYATDATYGAENVWTNEFYGVWHMGTTTLVDSTGLAADSSTNTGSNTTYANGKVGVATDYDGTERSIIPGYNEISDDRISDLYYFGIFEADSWNRSMEKSNQYFILQFAGSGDNGPLIKPANSVADSGTLPTSTWIQTGGRFTQSSGSDGVLDAVVNGAVVDTTSGLAAIESVGNTDLYLGSDDTSNFFNGRIDEFRISGYRSTGWMSTENHTLMDPDNFYSVGAEEEPSTSTDTYSETRDVTYTVVTEDSQTKSLNYEVTAADAVTKSLAYEVVTTDSVTRSVDYQVRGTDSVTRSITYAVTAADSVTRSVTYAVTVDDSVTRSIEYSLETDDSVTKSLSYEVVATDDEQRTLQYATITTLSEGRISEYQVTTSDSETRSLTYDIADTEVILCTDYIDITFDAITGEEQRSLTYAVLTTDDVTKSVDYAIISTIPETRTLTYVVETEDTIQKNLSYYIFLQDTKTRDTAYAVITTTPETRSVTYILEGGEIIQKGLTYVVISPQSETRGVEYSIVTTPTATTKTLDYYVVDTDAITKSLKYTVPSTESETRLLTYRVVGTGDVLTRGLTYAVTTEAAETRNLTYVVGNYVAIEKALTYVVLTNNAETRDLSYYTIETGQITKGLTYAVVASDSETRSVKYTVPSTSSETRSLGYEIELQVAISKALTYTVLSDNTVTKSTKYVIVQTTAEERSLTYNIEDVIGLTLGLQYAVATSDSETRSVAYNLFFTEVEQRTLGYEILSEAQITKSLQYAVTSEASEDREVKYTVVTTQSDTKSTAYYIVTEGELSRSLRYHLNSAPTLPNRRPRGRVVSIKPRGGTTKNRYQSGVMRSVKMRGGQTSREMKGIIRFNNNKRGGSL